jgi:prephenate dehydratase
VCSSDLLGPPGTFSDEALARCDLAAGAERVPYPTFPEAYQAALDGAVDAALLPIENSLEGSITTVVDLLVHRPGLRIRREVLLPVRQSLLGPAGLRLGDIEKVLSHPQPLGQCARFLRDKLPRAVLEATRSTTDAAAKVAAGEPRAAAIAAGAAAARYGLTVLVEDIQDADENLTRFVLMAREDEAPTGDDRTSIAFTLPRDRPGGLYEVLGEFNRRGLNLSKIESRPTRQEIGHYIFFLDFEAHRRDPTGAEALAAVLARVDRLHLLGSYPRCPIPT